MQFFAIEYIANIDLNQKDLPQYSIVRLTLLYYLSLPLSLRFFLLSAQRLSSSLITQTSILFLYEYNLSAHLFAPLIQCVPVRKVYFYIFVFLEKN